ncbi:MAG: alpha-hydroxy-acid oxidizing protein [Eisenbergiella massiliensis]
MWHADEGETLEELKEFVKATKLPFIVKGVLSERDAYKCLEAGVQGTGFPSPELWITQCLRLKSCLLLQK